MMMMTMLKIIYIRLCLILCLKFMDDDTCSDFEVRLLFGDVSGRSF